MGRRDHLSWRSGATRPKVWYGSLKAAEINAERLSLKYEMPMQSYRCSSCTGWHVGESPKHHRWQAVLTTLFADFIASGLRHKDMPFEAIVERFRLENPDRYRL